MSIRPNVRSGSPRTGEGCAPSRFDSGDGGTICRISSAVLDALDAATELRMACGRAVLITTSEEVKMPRADWDLIVDAAITQRRTVDPTAVDA